MKIRLNDYCNKKRVDDDMLEELEDFEDYGIMEKDKEPRRMKYSPDDYLYTTSKKSNKNKN